MVLSKCTKCGKGFRSTKAQEGMCASCTVESSPMPDNPQEVEREFAQISERVYGKSEPDLGDVEWKDILNHGKRLKVLQEHAQLIPDSKTRNRNSREINRLLEEHEAVQQQLTKVQNIMLKTVMFTTPSPPKEEPQPQSKDSQPALSSPKKSSFSSTTTTSTSPSKRTNTNNTNNATVTPSSGTAGSASVPGSGDSFVSAFTAPSDSPPTSNSCSTLSSAAGSTPVSPVKQAAAFFERVQRSNSLKSMKEPSQLQRSNSLRSPDKGKPKPTATATSTASPLPKKWGSSQSQTPLSGKGNKVHKGLGTLTENVPVLILSLKDNSESDADAEGETQNSENATNTNGHEMVTPDLVTDEVGPLKRSNSVRNRIKAFEDLTRRASTGSWDRNSLSRRKLEFCTD